MVVYVVPECGDSRADVSKPIPLFVHRACSMPAPEKSLNFDVPRDSRMFSRGIASGSAIELVGAAAVRPEVPQMFDRTLPPP